MPRLISYRTHTATVSGRGHLWTYHCHTCGHQHLALNPAAARKAALRHLHTH